MSECESPDIEKTSQQRQCLGLGKLDITLGDNEVTLSEDEPVVGAGALLMAGEGF
jgi:hypothetical protein